MEPPRTFIVVEQCPVRKKKEGGRTKKSRPTKKFMRIRSNLTIIPGKNKRRGSRGALWAVLKKPKHTQILLLLREEEGGETTTKKRDQFAISLKSGDGEKKLFAIGTRT